jgi:hypothetical protein
MTRLGLFTALALAATPAWAQELRLTPPLLLAQADAPAPAATAAPEPAPAAAATPELAAPVKPPLDFDLLGAPAAPATPAANEAPVDESTIFKRRGMFQVHQAIGISLLVLDLTTVVLGQLNYRDRFGGGGERSGRFSRAHSAFAYTTFALFVTNGLIALLAPVPPGRQSQGFDRTMLHRVSMLAAAACLVTQIVLGIVTVERAGRVDQQDLAKVHLFVGYGTFAALAVGAAAMVF